MLLLLSLTENTVKVKVEIEKKKRELNTITGYYFKESHFRGGVKIQSRRKETVN